ncbi:MAG: hypothetical protein V1754_10915 [Pseudomonadota bacterium]
MLKNKLILFCFVLSGLILSLSCNKTSSANPEQNSMENMELADKTQKKQSITVARIVFVGQKQACDCTRNRIETTWNTLSGVIKNRSNIPVKRIERDVDTQEAQKMNNLRPLMVVPGIYFFDKQDGLLELLQGEVAKDQIEKVIGS